MLIERKRLLIKNWEPIIPVVPHRKDFAFTLLDREWTGQRKEWLRKYFPDSENWQLAKALNATEAEITFEARAMHIVKSKRFVAWEKYDPDKREKGCPFGFHYETEEEREKRLEQEREQMQRRAEAIARSFDFCDKDEMESIVGVLMEAIKWGKETQPDNKYDFEYWN